MNRLLILILPGFLILGGCQKQALEEAQTLVRSIHNSPEKASLPADELPAGISAFMEEEEFHTFIDEALLSPGLGYEIISADEVHFFFDLKGNALIDDARGWDTDEFSRFLGPCEARGHNVNPRRLPSAIRRYINDNYPNNGPQRAKVMADGSFLVALNPPLMLVFTSTGRFVEEVYCFRPCGSAMQQIRPSELPEAIRLFLNEHFSAYEALAAYQLRNGNFAVGLFVNGKRVIVVFSADGTFLYRRGG